jgi:hypothetical protein
MIDAALVLGLGAPAGLYARWALVVGWPNREDPAPGGAGLGGPGFAASWEGRQFRT